VRPAPRRALALSVLALAAPFAATTLAPHWAEGDGALLIWLPALLPPFLLAYYKGWQGASLALAGGMAALALSQTETLLLDLPTPPAGYVFGIVVMLVGVAVGAGWIAELLHKERDAAERTALTDALTGLPNRRHASVFLEAGWGTALRGRSVALVLFDLDHFKIVNDTQGHAEGDRVLKALGTILSRRTRRMDLSARFGGEEFVSILMDCTSEQAIAFAMSVLEHMRGQDFGWGRVTLSAGVSTADKAMGSPDVLVAAADRALYTAKERGRNQVVLAAPVGPREPLPPPAGAEAAASGHTLEGCRVLLVDDDDLTLRATRRLLERLGCIVDATGSSREALSKLTGGQSVDVLATDIVMPDMSGFTLSDLAVKARPGLPVLYISGYPQEEVYWGGTPGTRSTFLGKPLDVGEVRTALLGLLGSGLPAAPAGPAEAVAPTARPAPTSLVDPATLGRILIVDDDPAVVASLQRFFTRAGYPEPIGLTDPRQVVETLASKGVDLVLLDLAMGKMDGFEVLSAVSRLLGDEEFLPVVMLTGSDDPGTRRKALAAGAMDFLHKPFDAVEAEVRVRNLLTTRFLTQRVARHRDALEGEVAARTSELADTRSEILYRLARAAEYRDDVTGRHAERVGLLAAALGSTMGLPPREVDLLRRTAPLHDVGKIGVPDSILLKAGRLTEAEFEVMKAHTTIGAQILGGSTHRILESARIIALHHHERWGGGGYPHGLRGADIPLEARIVGVADAFDTIAHARPYKAALPPGEALAEIHRCRTTHYDPDVVAALDAVKDRVGLENIHELTAPLDPARDTAAAPPTDVTLPGDPASR
jgi:putative two-component system response regulator